MLQKFDASEIQLLLDDALSLLEKSKIEQVLHKAIEKRLIFRQELLTALEADATNLNERRAAGYRSCVILLKSLQETSEMGRSVPEACSLKIQKRLASSVPPRPMVSLEKNEAFTDFQKFCRDAADVDQIISAETNQSFLTTLVTFMSRRPLPSSYVRALVQSSIGLRAQSLKDVVFSDLEALVLPNSLLLQDHSNQQFQENGHSDMPQMTAMMDDFVNRIGLTYSNMFRTLCLNRSRVRRTLCHSVIDLDNIQADAEDIDTSMRDFTHEEPIVYSLTPNPTYAYPLSSWIYHYKLWQLEQIIQLGFELTIYAIDELPKMYWYLSHICTTHLSHLDRISFFVEHAGRSKVGPAKPDQQGSPILEHQEKVDRTMKNLDRHFIFVRATDALARTLHFLYTVLDRHGALPKPPRPYSNDKLRYELRMRPFLPLSIPELVPYEDFERECSLSTVHDKDLLESASQSIVDARKGWEEVLTTKWLDESAQSPGVPDGSGSSLQAEWISGVKNTIRACIATSIAVATLRKKIADPSSNAALDNGKDKKGPTSVNLKVEIPLAGEKGCWHDWWIVPKIS